MDLLFQLWKGLKCFSKMSSLHPAATVLFECFCILVLFPPDTTSLIQQREKVIWYWLVLTFLCGPVITQPLSSVSVSGAFLLNNLIRMTQITVRGRLTNACIFHCHSLLLMEKHHLPDVCFSFSERATYLVTLNMLINKTKGTLHFPLSIKYYKTFCYSSGRLRFAFSGTKCKSAGPCQMVSCGLALYKKSIMVLVSGIHLLFFFTDVGSDSLFSDPPITGNYSSFMQKEIFEQPESVVNTMRGRVNFDDNTGQSAVWCVVSAEQWRNHFPANQTFLSSVKHFSD